MAKLKATTANYIYDVQVTNNCLVSRASHNLFALDKSSWQREPNALGRSCSPQNSPGPVNYSYLGYFSPAKRSQGKRSI